MLNSLRRERDIIEPLIPYLRVLLTIILSFRTPLNRGFFVVFSKFKFLRINLAV